MTGRAVTGRAERIPLPLLAASALVAAGFGWALLFRDRPFETTLAVVLGSAAVGALLAALLGQPLTDRARPPDRPPSGPDAGGAKPQTAPPQTGQPETTQPETAQLVLPVGEPAGGAPSAGQWWNRDAPPPAAPTTATAPTRPAPRDLGELRDSARVVQCPRCGAFRLDVRHAGAGYAFRCHADGHEWTWLPGTTWPAVVVASRRRNTR
ncbi:hypothetical protein AB1484_19155 [Parafrankia sp. FMc6]|uniref:hypothetical protein n=1 Tax=Parafrankia soli TaxID=2599596 RepID=UPI0034D56CDA